MELHDSNREDIHKTSAFSRVWHVFTTPKRWKILARCGIHIPSIAISATLLILNFSTVYYQRSGAPHQNLQFNALQLAAKFHEVLIVTSLSAVAISYVQYKLLEGSGISLGGLLAAFQVSALSSIWSPGLWDKPWTAGFKARRLLFPSSIAAIVVLASLAGPSSNILILPTLGWWELTLSPKPRVFANGTESELWPTHIMKENYLPPDCDTVFANESTKDQCPTGGVSQIFAQVAQIHEDIWKLTILPSSIDQDRGRRTIDGFTVPHLYADKARYYVTQTTSTLTDYLLQAFGAYSYLWTAFGWDHDPFGRDLSCELFLSSGTPLPAIQTISVCDSDNTTVLEAMNAILKYNITFPTMNNETWSTNEIGTEANLSISWINPPPLGNNTPSIAAATVYGSEIIAYSIYATWRPTHMHVQNSMDNSVQKIHVFDTMDLNVEEPSAEKILAPEGIQGTHMRIDPDWAASALPSNDTVLRLMREFDPKLWLFSDVVSAPFGISLSIFVADAIARVQTNVEVIIDTDVWESPWVSTSDSLGISFKDVESFNKTATTALNHKVSQNGYSYSVNNGLRRLAAAIILMHIVIAFVHTTVVVSYGWKSPTLKSLHESFLLAMNSPPPETTHQPSGSEKSKERIHTLKARPVSSLARDFILYDAGKPEQVVLEDSAK